MRRTSRKQTPLQIGSIILRITVYTTTAILRIASNLHHPPAIVFSSILSRLHLCTATNEATYDHYSTTLLYSTLLYNSPQTFLILSTRFEVRASLHGSLFDIGQQFLALAD